LGPMSGSPFPQPPPRSCVRAVPRRKSERWVPVAAEVGLLAAARARLPVKWRRAAQFAIVRRS
jgi:hypothetical protein